jgi:hypothetical protein
MGIDVIGKKHDIQHQAGHRNRRNLGFISLENSKKIPESKSGIESDKIINGQADDRGDKPKHQTQPKVIFFKNHDFHVFSSLLLRT